MNNIDIVRAETLKYFDPEALVSGSEEVFVSATGKFRLETSSYRQTKADLNWFATKAHVFDNLTGDQLFSFISNDGSFFHSWLLVNGIEYLICAEDLFGGQTVIDLPNRRMASYSPNEDGFIWTSFSLSPNGELLATMGCYWACPYVIKIYHFKVPLSLPLRELDEINLLCGDEEFLDWINNKTLRTINGKKEERRIEIRGC